MNKKINGVRLTPLIAGNVLDANGGYRETVTIAGTVYAPRYFSCATSECIASGSNLDTSDPQTQAYIAAMVPNIIFQAGYHLPISSGIAVGQNGTLKYLKIIDNGRSRVDSIYLKLICRSLN
jgi:hypothetical protein